MSNPVPLSRIRTAIESELATVSTDNQMFDVGFEAFDNEQLLRLLDPENRAANKLVLANAGPGAPWEQKQYGDLPDSARIQWLSLAYHVANSDYAPAHRDRIQDRLISASNQRCNLYMTYLKRIGAYTNGAFGTLTTILGGAGAIVRGEQAARTLSGLSGISSGMRAELNQAIFESVATSVIVPAIQQRRKALLDEILKKRQVVAPVAVIPATTLQYTVEGATADAIAYHGACSMDDGIAQAARSIQIFDDVGRKQLLAVQQELAAQQVAEKGGSSQSTP